MKKLILALVMLPLSSLCANSWPSALTLPLILPMLTGNQEGMEAVADSLNFHHSRQIACRLELPQNKNTPTADADDFAHEDTTSPLTVDYHLRWGYHGAGEKTKPFTGVRGRLHIQVSYDGLSFHLCKSRSLRKKIYQRMAPLLTVSPCQEFYLKLGQLIWTVSQHPVNHIEDIMQSLQTLVARLKLTPGGAKCKLYGMSVLSSPEKPGLEFWLSQAPKEFAHRFVVMSQKIGVALGLLVGPPRSPEKQAYLRALLSQIDYYQEEPYHLSLPKGGSITLPFSSVGSGNPLQPFTGTTMSIQVPPTTRSANALAPNSVPQITQWDIALKPEHECLARIALLMMHNRKNPLPSYKFTEELSTLFARMSITPRSDDSEPGSIRAFLGLACQYHQQIARHDFSQQLNEFLDPSQLLLQLTRVAYKTYTLTIDKQQSPQEIADFATLHTADALRCYRGTQELRKQCQDKARVPFLEKKGITLDTGLFLRTLFQGAPAPEVIDYESEFGE